MSDEFAPWERDIQWLVERLGKTCENERDEFAERVAVLVAEGMTEANARDTALELIKEKRKS